LKAELFSSDFIIGLTVFLIALNVFAIYYTNLQNDVTDYKIRNEVQIKANNVANLLATSSGDPEFWDSTNVKVLGLQDSNMINLTKFDELKKIDYFVAKRMMGVGGYEFYVELKNETDQIIGNYTFGKTITSSALQVFYVERYGLASVNGTVSKIILGVAVWS
jgi:hypothetical protein